MNARQKNYVVKYLTNPPNNKAPRHMNKIANDMKIIACEKVSVRYEVCITNKGTEDVESHPKQDNF